jgi:uncharacterized protein (DUF433 family)
VATTRTSYEPIVLDDGGTPSIIGTTMKVIELVTAQYAHGWSPEEPRFQFPALTLGQIHSALAYYWDHQADLDQEIDRRLTMVDAWQRQEPPSPLRERLRGQRQP